MNHGGIGYLNGLGLYIATDLLNPIALQTNATAYGVYYPINLSEASFNSTGDETLSAEEVKHDFMLTPVPPRFWPCSARLTVRIKHIAGATHAVASALNNNGWNIINAECTRSAYRYATWNLIVSYVPLALECTPENRGKAEATQQKLFTAIKNLRPALRAECADYLLETKRAIDRDLRRPVRITQMAALAYFHHISTLEQYAQQHNKLKSTFYMPFELTVSKEGFIDSSKAFEQILERACGLDVQKRRKVIYLFCEMDTDNANLRIALLQDQTAQRFVHIVVDYERSGGEHSKGLLASILEPLSGFMNIYRVSNVTKQDHVHDEIGQYQITGKLTELRSRSDNNGDYSANLAKHLRDRIMGIPKVGDLRVTVTNGISTMEDGFKLAVPLAKPLSAVRTRSFGKARRNEARVLNEHDVFVSHSRLDRELVVEHVLNKLATHKIDWVIDDPDLLTSEPIEAGILDKISKSRELLVVMTENSIQSEWVNFEIGIAKALGKPVHVVHTRAIKPENCKSFLNTQLFIPIMELDRVIDSIIENMEIDFI